ncbi:VanZ family protein [Dysgonomonas sp. 520]|uniref:VanZ family protein n=1 Tax=Dysgonomonas sp. 520 TaxID=2302931 RepID=UPI0013D68784|nr:VanZ family protein [Dysgonomonas sp. 520]NDW09106.1 hypothetical protein [Dysgonomonas sp. 520]
MILRFFKHSYVPVIIALVIFYLCCLIPPDDVPDIGVEFFIPMDKLVHFCMYFGLSGAAAVNYIWNKKGQANVYKLIIGAFLLPVIYGGLIELVQHYYFPPRAGDWYDFMADTLGSIAALPIAFYFRKYLLKKYAV